MNISYQKKLHYLFLLFCTGFGIIGTHLYILQIHRHTFFIELGKKQYQITFLQIPPRAPIFDRTGKKYLAMNTEQFSAFILPKELKQPEQLKKFLATYFPKALERLSHTHDSYFLYIKRHLTDAQIADIQKANLQDIHLLKEPSRFYPIACVGPIVGITDIDNKGIMGIELLCNDILAGKPTTLYLERDARLGHFYFSKQTHIEGKTGNPVILTIDSRLQFLVYEELKKTIMQFNAKEGALVIINPATGEILSMAQYPDFDPNTTENLALETTRNRVVTDAYEFGSVFKVFTALAALEEGVVTLDEIIDCKNTKTAYIDGRKINTVFAGGLLTLQDIIRTSNNIGVALIAKRLGPKLYDHLISLGFGQKVTFDFPGQQAGSVNHPRNWSKQSLISLSYGYEVRATLLQLARAFCIIARNGTDIAFRLIVSPTHDTPYQPLRARYTESSIKNIKDILSYSYTKHLPANSALKNYNIMSKTGTANLLVNGQYVHDCNIFTCGGIVEHDTYKRVVVVFVKEAEKKNLLAAHVAAPLFDRVVEKMIIHDNVM